MTRRQAKRRAAQRAHHQAQDKRAFGLHDITFDDCRILKTDSIPLEGPLRRTRAAFLNALGIKHK